MCFSARTNQIHYPDLGSYDVISTEFLPLTPRRLSQAFPMVACSERGEEPRLFRRVPIGKRPYWMGHGRSKLVTSYLNTSHFSIMWRQHEGWDDLLKLFLVFLVYSSSSHHVIPVDVFHDFLAFGVLELHFWVICHDHLQRLISNQVGFQSADYHWWVVYLVAAIWIRLHHVTLLNQIMSLNRSIKTISPLRAINV